MGMRAVDGNSYRQIHTHIYIYVCIYKLLPILNLPRKLYFHFFSNFMGYDRGDNFPFNFEPNGIPFRSEN